MTGDGARPNPPSLGFYLLHTMLKEEGVKNVSYHGRSNKMQVHFHTGRTVTFDGPPGASAAVTYFSPTQAQEAIEMMRWCIRRETMPDPDESTNDVTYEPMSEEEALEVHYTTLAALKTVGRTITGALYNSAAKILRLELDDGSTFAINAVDGSRLSAHLYTGEEVMDVLTDLKKRVEELEKQMTPEQREQKMEKDV